MTIGTTARYRRELDRLPGAETVQVGEIDLEPLLGLWRNANPDTWGISAVELTERAGAVWARAWANDPRAATARDWGEAPLDGLYTTGPTASLVCAYRVSFDLGHARTQIQGNMLHNVMVCGAFTRFTDGSGRANYFSREFLHRRGRDA